MKTLHIYRRPALAAALTPFWVVTGISKAEFMARYGLADDASCRLDAWGHPLPRAAFDPDAWGVRIACGQRLALPVPDSAAALFAMTAEGLLSNEVPLPAGSAVLVLGTRGGFLRPGRPYFIL